MKKYWSNPKWWDSHDPYPPPPGGPYDKDWWWYGDRDAPNKKEKGHWDKGKFVPIDVANHVQERLGKEVEKLRGEIVKNEVDLKQQLNNM